MPLSDLETLTQYAAIRSNGSATATQASAANQYVYLTELSMMIYLSVLTQILHCRELLNYIGGLVDKRIEKPGNDLISKLVTEQVSYKHNHPHH